MNISQDVESVLIRLAQLERWPQFVGEMLHIHDYSGQPESLPADLSDAIRRHKPEVAAAAEYIATEDLSLTGPVVRILFEMLTDEQREASRLMAARLQIDRAFREKTNAWFYKDHHKRTLDERVQYLWAAVYQPAAESLNTPIAA